MACGKNGVAKLMLTKIPFFRGKYITSFIEIIINSFACEECGYKNSEVQFGGKLADFGVKMVCQIISPTHLNRLIVKSEYASIKIPELNVDIPPLTQSGTMNTVEGIINKMIEGLSEGQEDRKSADPESYKKLEEFLSNAKLYATGNKLPFTIYLDDPSGNSFIQNPYAPSKDPYNIVEYYIRSKDQIQVLNITRIIGYGILN